MADILIPTPEQAARAQRYPLNILPSEVEDEAFVATVPDLPNVIGVGDTPGEAAAVAVQHIADAIALLEDLGRPVPDPGSNASGLFQVRAPRSLHRALIARAATEGVSVNSVVNLLLTRGLALEEVIELPKPRPGRKRPGRQDESRRKPRTGG